MKQRFQILNDPRFHLVYGISQRFSDGPSPSKVRLNREGFTLAQNVKKKAVVHSGMLLAEHPSIEKGDLFSPIYGEITEINERSIFISALPQPPDTPEVEPVDLLQEGLEGDELVMRCKKMGLNTRSLGCRCETLIINGLNPDPGVTWTEPMLNSHIRTFHAAMELHRRMGRFKNVILAIPQGSHLSYDGVKTVHVPAEYPNSLNPLLIKNVTGEENPEGFGCIGLHNLWSLGRVGRTGLPLTETVITIGSYEHSGNYIVKDGSTVGELLDFARIALKDHDTVVRGGPLRGESVDRLDRSITKGTYGLFVVEAGTIPPMEGHSSCINCGACVLICPARLSPSNLSRYAEFALHERCRKEHIDICMDCGLCGYVCIARRPVLQYIRLAKQKLAEKDAQKQREEIKITSA